MRWYEALLLAVSLGVVAWLLLLWHVRSWERRLAVQLEYVLEERLGTPDGSRIELRRLPAPEVAAPLPPVLVVHGVGANHRNNDLTEDLSLARHLRNRGRDVWLLTLRSGLAVRSIADARRVRFSAMVSHDLPLAVREVLSRTGADHLDYVGFSMGGMLLYGALSRTLSHEQVRRVAIVGSPAVVRPPVALSVPRFVTRIPSVVYPTLRLKIAARIWAFAVEWVTTPMHRWVFNPRNVKSGVPRLSMVNVIEDVPGPLNADFASWAASPGGMVTLEGQPVLEQLRRVGRPVVFFAGSVDKLAPPEAVRAAYDAWGADLEGVEKRFVLLSRENGASEDYGHGDLAIGARVEKEIFEPLAAFLALAEGQGSMALGRAV